MITSLLWILAQLARPHIAHCPPHWLLNGVRPSGAFTCRPRPIRNLDVRTEVDDGTPDLEIPGRVWCRADEIAVVVDWRTAGCRRRS